MDNTPPPPIAGLLDPGAYPHEATDVELVETHISWVLLAGSFAYKVKKPVDFGFVDFSSLDRRHAFCEEELRLNRRLAPDLYLDVVPVTGSPEAPRMGGDGPAIEFAVKMRRFRREDELASLVAHGALESRHVEALAELVSEFHARAAAHPPDPAWGSPEQVLAHWIGNFAVIARTGLASPERERLAALEAWTRAQHARHAALIAARQAAGFVRECHGDLHLGNIVLIDDRPLPFDALEFDPALRWTDVVAEIAFTMMDLEHHGRGDLARRFLDAWLERTGDFAGLALLPSMLAYRAMVRAKVACLRASQACDDARREMGIDELRAHLALAERFAAPGPRALAITTGVSGSGKSRLALALAEHAGWVRIRSDVERKRMAGLRSLDRAGSGPGTGLYSSDRTARAYERLGSLARAVVEAGFPALVDATFLLRVQRDAFRAAAAACGASFGILAVDAPEAVLRARVLRRAAEMADASDANVEVLERQLAAREPLAEEELACTVRVDTSADVDPVALGRALLARSTPSSMRV